MADDRDFQKHSALIWAMGAACGVTIGVLIALIWRDRRASSAAAPINIWNMNGGGGVAQLPMGQMGQFPMPVTQTATAQTAAEVRPTKMETFTLSTDLSNPSRVMTASGHRHWKAQLYHIGPPGSFARIAKDPNALAYPGMSVTIPAGGNQEVKLAPGEALFGVGSAAGVTLSVVGSEDLA